MKTFCILFSLFVKIAYKVCMTSDRRRITCSRAGVFLCMIGALCWLNRPCSIYCPFHGMENTWSLVCLTGNGCLVQQGKLLTQFNSRGKAKVLLNHNFFHSNQLQPPKFHNMRDFARFKLNMLVIFVWKASRDPD